MKWIRWWRRTKRRRWNGTTCARKAHDNQFSINRQANVFTNIYAHKSCSLANCIRCCLGMRRGWFKRRFEEGYLSSAVPHTYALVVLRSLQNIVFIKYCRLTAFFSSKPNLFSFYITFTWHSWKEINYLKK